MNYCDTVNKGITKEIWPEKLSLRIWDAIFDFWSSEFGSSRGRIQGKNEQINLMYITKAAFSSN